MLETSFDPTDLGTLIAGVGLVFWLLLGFGLWLAVTRPATKWGKALALLIVGGLFWFVPGKASWEAYQAKREVQKARAMFQERCATVAGEKIYKKVENVEGILLMKVRPLSEGRQWADQYFPGAAFSHESAGGPNEFIQSFLLHEGYTRVDGKQVASKLILTAEPTDLPGYRYVDVIDEKDGKRYRYTGRWEEPWQYDKSYLKGYIKFFLDKAPAPSSPAPRYGVTFEDHVIPEERARWIASGSVKVIDLETKEVLGEMNRYVWAVGPRSSARPSPWLSGKICGGHSDHQPTRFFVDQVLLPAKAK